MLLRCVTRSWVASALSACQPCTCPELPPLRETRLGRGLVPRKRWTPQGPGASFPNSGHPVTWLSSCVESRAAIARSPVPGPLFALAQMFAQLMATFSGNLPPWLPASPGKRKPLPPQRRACQALAPVRRLVLRHRGRLDWEVHSVLSQPHLSSLCRVAQVEDYLVRGLGPSHGHIGPFLAMIPEINYPCACGGFLSLENSGWVPKSHPELATISN